MDEFYCYCHEKPATLDVILCQNLTSNNLPPLSSDGSISTSGFKVSDTKDCLAILINIPIPIIENNKDDPPELTKGNGMPFVGTMPETTAMLIIACNPNITVIPNPKKNPNTSLVACTIFNPCHINDKKRHIIANTPINPNSSPIMVKIKSLLLSGKKNSFCLLLPTPKPAKPPDPRAIHDWII